MTTGDELRDRAIAVVDAAAPAEWKDMALDAVYQVCLHRTWFGSDDVWAELKEPPPEPRALGAIMVKAQRLGYCEAQDDWNKSSLPRQHSRPVRLWKSKIR